MADSDDPVPTQNPHFYLDSVVFLVEGDLFKVYRHFFEKSSVFATIFTLPPGDNDVEGSSDAHPFRLEGVAKFDFECLLRLMHLHVPFSQSNAPQYTRIKMTSDEWISVLKLSTMWEFSEYRKLAIDKLSKSLRLVDKICLAKEYKVADWLMEGYIGLASRQETISSDDEEKLGLSTVVRLFRLREGRRRCESCGRDCHYCPSSNWDARTEVRKAFLVELVDAGYSYQ